MGESGVLEGDFEGGIAMPPAIDTLACWARFSLGDFGAVGSAVGGTVLAFGLVREKVGAARGKWRKAVGVLLGGDDGDGADAREGCVGVCKGVFGSRDRDEGWE